MPLVLSLQQDSDFYVGEEQFFVARIVSNTEFTLRRARDRQLFHVDDKATTEVNPGVMVSAGERQQPNSIRIAITAPSNVLVLRGDKKRNPPPGVREGQRR
jgi:hypothetical protein